MNKQKPHGRPAPLNISPQYQWDPNNIGQDIERTNRAIADILNLVHGVMQRVDSLYQYTTKAFTPLPNYIADTKARYDECYRTYAHEFQAHRDTQAAYQETKNVLEEMRNALAQEQEAHLYKSTELGLLKQTLDDERIVREDLEARNTKLGEEHEKINNEMRTLIEAINEQKQVLENDNQAMRATINKLQEGREKAGAETLEEIVVGEPTLQTKVRSLEEEKESLEKRLQEATDAVTAGKIELQTLQAQQSSRGHGKRRRAN
ncbi:hypothetical protein K432DRAFT_408372 [Lepidopterella palustris CBS 459.81]|uniref:Uncharacterized protein n=1 Tax=Lepidopterella palustris CBS 459.81 TaxID=1314670 RepID=A0A8E2JB72_9PEZI|nr:hypothetical protein K432DRAFT_408372 [Lepidopterella palustris CBS 459.81]